MLILRLDDIENFTFPQLNIYTRWDLKQDSRAKLSTTLSTPFPCDKLYPTLNIMFLMT